MPFRITPGVLDLILYELEALKSNENYDFLPGTT